jgi:hypothetical protein
MAKWKELPPSPEAIVRAALERAAGVADRMQGAGSEAIRNTIRDLASNPAEVAVIIMVAGVLNKERSDEEDRG